MNSSRINYSKLNECVSGYTFVVRCVYFLYCVLVYIYINYLSNLTKLAESKQGRKLNKKDIFDYLYSKIISNNNYDNFDVNEIICSDTKKNKKQNKNLNKKYEAQDGNIMNNMDQESFEEENSESNTATPTEIASDMCRIAISSNDFDELFSYMYLNDIDENDLDYAFCNDDASILLLIEELFWDWVSTNIAPQIGYESQGMENEKSVRREKWHKSKVSKQKMKVQKEIKALNKQEHFAEIKAQRNQFFIEKSKKEGTFKCSQRVKDNNKKIFDMNYIDLDAQGNELSLIHI